ncbi:MAG: AtpZ/AtpI family protein [Elusimicrobia bacterium]|nr:AtpZ/AtpI family protein [Elusimicrobiota bacterium]MBI4218290.1 AtpZ/AtpI family protein [Elusimicrobiota bacterium]
MKNWNSLVTSFKYIGVGLQLAVTILFGLFLGYLVDQKTRLTPWFTLIGSAIGLAVGFYHLVVELKQNEKKDQ